MRADTEKRIQDDLGEDAAKQYMQLSQENASLQQKENELRKILQDRSKETTSAFATASVL